LRDIIKTRKSIKCAIYNDKGLIKLRRMAERDINMNYNSGAISIISVSNVFKYLYW